MVGGTSPEKAASEEVQQLVSTVKGEVEGKLGRTLQHFVLVCYKTQVVAGMNYFAKIDIGDGEALHARVYKNLQGQVSLHDLQYPKTLDEAIHYF